MKRAQHPEYMLPINGELVRLKDKAICEMSSAEHDMIDEYIFQHQLNPLAFSLVHGRPRDDGTNDVQAMCNNYEDDLIILTAGNQFGKSRQGAIYVGLRAVPCDPSWPCFTQHGLKWHEWRGPQEVIISSYSWATVNVVWNTYRQTLPRDELGEYAPDYGTFPHEKGRARNLSFASGQAKQLQLKCGTRLTFLCYTQGVGKWSGRQCDLAHCDEQIPELHYEELSERQSTRGDYTPIIMTLTGHVIDDRPDTGASGWIKQKLVDQGLTKGRKLAQYSIAIEDVPDALMSKDKKAQKYKQWVEEPNTLNDERAIRAAEARYYGGWEVGGSLTFSEFNPNIHMIEPFDVTKYKPTYYRMVDHGEKPCAAALFAMMPWGDVVMVKEYYEFNKSIEENVQGILQMCGNRRRKIGIYDESKYGSWTIYDEEFVGLEPFTSQLDTRSFGRKMQLFEGMTIGQLYNQFGLYCTRSTGLHDKLTIPVMKQWLAMDSEREHINLKIGRKYDDNLARFGAPRMYFFNTCINVQGEISKYMGDDKDDHLIACCLAGDTEVLCIDGEKPIKDVMVGDMVLTRQGYKRVTHSALTRQNADVVRMILSNGRDIVCTPDHEIFCTEKNLFIPVDQLHHNAVLYHYWNEPVYIYGDDQWRQTQLHTGAYGLTDIQIANANRMRDIIALIRDTYARASSTFTSKYGRTPTAWIESLKATLFITLTVIRSTMIRRTWRRLQNWSTRSVTRIQASLKNILRNGWLAQDDGGNHKRGNSLCGRRDVVMPSTLIRPAPLTPRTVTSAALSMFHAELLEQGSVPRDVVKDIMTKLDDFTKRDNARCVGKPIASRSTASEQPVRLLALEPCDQKIDTYDIEVEDAHEFFANGILVHNCKWMCALDPTYQGDYGVLKPEEPVAPLPRNSITGY